MKAEEVLSLVRDWLDAYYDQVGGDDHDERWMTQLDHGHEEYEARMDIAVAVRAFFDTTTVR